MDAKTIKSLLKETKEALKNKDFQSALKSCKEVLKADRNNYVALVFFGAALQETDASDQAPNAFRKAIEVSPDQLLAWHGLSSFYEKNGADKHAEQLIPVYQRCLQLESDDNKWCEVLRKLEPLLIRTDNAEVLAAIMDEHLQVDNLNKQQALHQLLKNCLLQITVPAHLSALFGKLLRVAISSISAGDCRTYFNIFYKHRLYEALLEAAKDFSQYNPEDIFSREWSCKVFAEQYVENRQIIVGYESWIAEHVKILLRYNPNNVNALTAQGVMHMLADNYIEAREVLKQCLSVERNLFHGACLLSIVHLKLLNWSDAERWAEAALGLNSPSSKFALLLLIKSLAFSDKSDNWKRVVDLLKDHDYLVDDYSVVECCARAYLKLEDWEAFGQAISKLQSDSTYNAVTGLLTAEVKAKQGIADLIDSLRVLVDMYPDNAEIMFKLGLQYEEKNDYQSAHTMFIKTAKLAPYWYKVYLHLGYNYSHSQDYDKARRCYQKAFQLAPDSDETGIALSDVYKLLGDVKTNLALLELISTTRNAKWAWLRLGLQYLEAGDSTAAIKSLRAALRTDPNQSHLWEALADAYLSRGSYSAALKSYEKVAELRPGAFYPKLQIATIKQVTDLPEESLIEFRELLESDSNSVLALKGLSETCLCLAKNFLERRLLGLAKDRLQEGLDASASALGQRDNIACLWKIVGDIVTLAAQLPRSMSSLEVPEFLRSPNQPALVYGVNLLQLGVRCYIRALRQMGEKESSSFVWHDLAFNYRLQAVYTTETKESQSLCEKALACAKKSVVLAPYRWQHWNLLGIIAVLPGVKNYALAQHAFIKAVVADETVPVPWTNLGTLYFMLNNVRPANLAFKFAQRVDPAYRQSWIGQALIAESVSHDETMDLFRHTIELGYHPESCMGYAQMVCSTLQALDKNNKDYRYVYSIENMHALPVAIDSLTWATDSEEDNACGLNMLGCLFERCGQFLNAARVLNRALQYASSEHKDIVRGNLARVLLRSDNIQNAINVYKSITKADFHSLCGLALSLFKGDQLEESFTTYESCLHWMASDDAVMSHLLVAMAAVSYKLSGVDKAKTLLFQCIQKKAPKSVYGLFAACAFGMLNNDLVLSKAALKELQPFQEYPDYISHIAVFQAYVKYIQGQFRESVWSLSKTLHRQPWHASLWLNLALMLLQNQSVNSEKHHAASAARCAQSAMALGRDTIDVTKILAVVSVSHLIVGDLKRALSASQHAVHLFPSVGESWAVLAASCHSRLEPTQLRLLLSHARQNLDLQRPLAKWMSNFERKISLIS